MFVHDGEHIPEAPALAPGDSDTYGVYWGNFLRDGETIVSSQWTTDLTVGQTSTDGSVTESGTTFLHCNFATVSGGASGRSYLLSNTITTNQREQTRSMRIPCKAL